MWKIYVKVRTLRAIATCWTAALGDHIDVCNKCETLRISYISCRNRRCTKCQKHKREEWIQRRELDLLPCTYYHLVFTLPETFNESVMYCSSTIYDLLFKSAWATLNQFGRTEELQMGMIAVLHT